MQTLRTLAAVAICILSSTTIAHASVSQLVIEGYLDPGATYVNFHNQSQQAIPAPGYGRFNGLTDGTGIFLDAGITGSIGGNVQSLNQTGNVSLANPFITFDENPTLTLIATRVAPGANGILTLMSQSDELTTGRFEVDGNAVLNGKTVGAFAANFDVEIDGLSKPQVLANWPTDVPYEADIEITPHGTTVVPLPSGAQSGLAGLITVFVAHCHSYWRRRALMM